jgi:phosphoglucomutase
LKELAKQIGIFYIDRINISFPSKNEPLLAKLGGGLQTIGAFKVEKFITTDGYKFLLTNNEWVAFRASGTEPLIRCYIEAKSKANLKKLDAACRQLLAS